MPLVVKNGFLSILAKQVGQIESDLKVKSQAYNALKTSLQSMEKKQTGSLMTRNLGDLVKKEHFILDSEYLTTMLVVVPISMINDWHAKYETLTDMIVPRSTSMIFQDSEHALMTVSLFHKVVEEFKHKVIYDQWSRQKFQIWVSHFDLCMKFRGMVGP